MLSGCDFSGTETVTASATGAINAHKLAAYANLLITMASSFGAIPACKFTSIVDIHYFASNQVPPLRSRVIEHLMPLEAISAMRRAKGSDRPKLEAGPVGMLTGQYLDPFA